MDYIRVGNGVVYIRPVYNASGHCFKGVEHELIDEHQPAVGGSAHNLSVNANWCPRFNDFDIGILAGGLWDYDSAVPKMLTRMASGVMGAGTMGLIQNFLEQVRQLDVSVLEDIVQQKKTTEAENKIKERPGSSLFARLISTRDIRSRRWK